MKSSILLLLISLLHLTVFGQYRDEKNREHYVHQDGLNYRFHYLNEDINQANLKTDKVYYWYQSQKINSTQGGAGGKLLTGEMYVSYPSKQLKEFGTFKRGLKNGVWKYWSEGGLLLKTECWNRGELKKVVNYENGVEVGIITYRWNKVSYHFHDYKLIRKGRKSKHVLYSESGLRSEVIRTKNDKLHGVQFCRESSKRRTLFWKGEIKFQKRVKEDED